MLSKCLFDELTVLLGPLRNKLELKKKNRSCRLVLSSSSLHTIYSFSPFYKETAFHFGGSLFGVYVECKIENPDDTDYNKS